MRPPSRRSPRTRRATVCRRRSGRASTRRRSGCNGLTAPGNFAALIDAAVQRAPEQIAVIDGDLSLTYGELARRAAGLAPWLAERGVRRGDRVALVLPNGAAFVIALYGALRAG